MCRFLIRSCKSCTYFFAYSTLQYFAGGVPVRLLIVLVLLGACSATHFDEACPGGIVYINGTLFTFTISQDSVSVPACVWDCTHWRTGAATRGKPDSLGAYLPVSCGSYENPCSNITVAAEQAKDGGCLVLLSNLHTQGTLVFINKSISIIGSRDNTSESVSWFCDSSKVGLRTNHTGALEVFNACLNVQQVNFYNCRKVRDTYHFRWLVLKVLTWSSLNRVGIPQSQCMAEPLRFAVAQIRALFEIAHLSSAPLPWEELWRQCMFLVWWFTAAHSLAVRLRRAK